MKPAEGDIGREGAPPGLAGLDADERRLVARLRRRARTHPDWCDFEDYWMAAVAAFYDARGLSRAASRRTAVYRIAQDLGSRLAVVAGLARTPDYRDQLEELIRERFPSRRALCQAAGLSEDMLSHVLARRKDLSLEAFTRALERVGYRLQIMPAPEQKQTC